MFKYHIKKYLNMKTLCGIDELYLDDFQILYTDEDISKLRKNICKHCLKSYKKVKNE